MNSGQAVDERVAISRGTCSPLASPVRRRRTAGPFFPTYGVGRVDDDLRLLFCFPTQLDGAGGGGRRPRICAGADLEPLGGFAPLSSLN